MSKKIDDWVKNELLLIDPRSREEAMRDAINSGLRSVTRKQKIVLHYWLHFKLWKATHWAILCYEGDNGFGMDGKTAFEATKKYTKKQYKKRFQGGANS